MSTATPIFMITHGRTPQGVRGLKCVRRGHGERGHLSHPARGAWIEIGMDATISPVMSVAPRKGCVD